MPSSISRALAVTLLGAFSSAASLASAQGVMAQHVPSIVMNGQAQAMAPLEASQHLRLTISLPLRDEAALDSLLADIYNPASPNFHHYLTPDEFDAQFAPTAADYGKLVSWAQSEGFSVLTTTANRRLIDVDAPVAVINRALHVSLKTFHDGVSNRDFHAPDT